MATRHADRALPSQPQPSSPPTQQYQQQQPPHRRGISFSGKSDKSRRSSNSGGKISLHETHEEKAKRNLHTKADPTLAMNEAQPATVAMEKSNLGSLRSMQHKDQHGNIITDPDLSNPTRPRLERPLDTIRSFEAAIDGSYHSRRLSYVTEAAPSRPASYYGANGADARGSYAEYNQHGGARGNNNRPRNGNGRMNSDSGNGNGYGQQQNYYQSSPYTQSNDNFTAGSGSANTDQWGNSTDPSSVNSSYDRLQQQQQQQQRYGQDYYNNGGPPAPPPHRQSFNQPAGGSGGINPALPAPTKRVMDDDKKKRGSWLKRRFNKD